MAVPWLQIIKWMPAILDVSRDLLKRSKQAPVATTLVRAQDPSDLANRIAALEENERRQAELVNRMAEQTGQLTNAVVALHRQFRNFAIGIGSLLVVLIVVVTITR